MHVTRGLRRAKAPPLLSHSSKRLHAEDGLIGMRSRAHRPRTFASKQRRSSVVSPARFGESTSGPGRVLSQLPQVSSEWTMTKESEIGATRVDRNLQFTASWVISPVSGNGAGRMNKRTVCRSLPPALAGPAAIRCIAITDCHAATGAGNRALQPTLCSSRRLGTSGDGTSFVQPAAASHCVESVEKARSAKAVLVCCENPTSESNKARGLTRSSETNVVCATIFRVPARSPRVVLQRC